jgi:hypothetical protein
MQLILGQASLLLVGEVFLKEEYILNFFVSLVTIFCNNLLIYFFFTSSVEPQVTLL